MNVPVPEEMLEEIVEVVQINSQEHVSEHIAEQKFSIVLTATFSSERVTPRNDESG